MSRLRPFVDSRWFDLPKKGSFVDITYPRYLLLIFPSKQTGFFWGMNRQGEKIIKLKKPTSLNSVWKNQLLLLTSNEKKLSIYSFLICFWLCLTQAQADATPAKTPARIIGVAKRPEDRDLSLMPQLLYISQGLNTNMQWCMNDEGKFFIAGIWNQVVYDP